jgi:hypothetical protein
MTEGEISWAFPAIFESDESRRRFVVQVLIAFKEFPPDTKLNYSDFYGIFSLLIRDLPYNFIAFVCECVDPSISSGTLMAHRMAFGNFLLALPCCVLFPQFMHEFLTRFKNVDRHRRGVIARSRCAVVLRKTFQKFVEREKPSAEDAEEEDEDDSEEEDASRPMFSDCKVLIDPKRLPTFDLIAELSKATVGLEDSSVQTLLFVMWQKDPTLLACKAEVHPGGRVDAPTVPGDMIG